ncbi:hypothetical protein [Chitinophaga nivalis]|uniref:Uncharacterized protein n=1 Tax=Chitinophaga nivalis TaxID=2991709 RepID=A0ABT3IH22_9BACT|nr:hypothetical protein [Chitinophaga nivalis]MCW3467041.1 hypothetical protein [Chitinophaga nivalis]MCW3483268.1 hypothetical protein [Chitinophaga nivalis]
MDSPITFLYTIRATFNKEGKAWDNYIRWSKLHHLTELVSLDTSLNEVLVEPDRDDDNDWKHIVIDNYRETGFFTTLDYVLTRTVMPALFNLLIVAIEPEQDCKSIKLDGYDFIGYELLDQYYDTSALTNCGGFDNTFLPTDLNRFGLIDDYEKAYDIKKRLWQNNQEEEHADTNVIAVWRHRVVEIL